MLARSGAAPDGNIAGDDDDFQKILSWRRRSEQNNVPSLYTHACVGIYIGHTGKADRSLSLDDSAIYFTTHAASFDLQSSEKRAQEKGHFP